MSLKYFHFCFLITLLAFICISCDKNFKKEAELNSAVSINTQDESISIDSDIRNVIKNLDFLVLEGIPKEDYISSIDKILEHRNQYFVLDAKKSNILVFDFEGNFITKVGQRGGGPEEYKSIIDFDIDNERNEVILLDSQLELTIYSSQNNAFLRSIRFDDFYPDAISLIESGIIACSVGHIIPGGYGLKIISTEDGSLLKELGKYPEDFNDVKSYDFSSGVNKSSQKTYFTYRSSSVIREIDLNLDWITSYKFDFGSDTWPEEKKFDLGEFDSRVSIFDLSVLTNNYYIANDVIAFEFLDKAKFKQAYYFVNSQKLYKPNNEADAHFLRFISIPTGYSNSNKFMSGILYEQYLSYSESNKDILKVISDINQDFSISLKKLDYDKSAMIIFYDIEQP